MAFRLRLLPLTMVATGMLLAVKVADVLHSTEEFAQASLVTSVKAQTTDEAKTAPTPPPAEGTDKKPAADAKKPDAPEAKSPPPAASSSSSSTGGAAAASSSASSTGSSSTSSGSSSGSSSASSSGSSSGAASTGSSSSGAGEGKDKDKSTDKDKPAKPDELATKGGISTPPTEEQQTGGKGLSPGARYFSPIELEILQTLSKRREAQDQWSKDMEIKENLLSNTEKRIDEKIVEIETLKKEVQEVLNKYNQQEDAKIHSLVKIYENMDPKDAARIFDEVEMPILLLVIDRMSEKKAAPILASMDAKKAKQLTVELAEERRLQGAKAASKAAPLTTAPVNSKQ